MRNHFFFAALIILIGSTLAPAQGNIITLGTGDNINEELIYPGKITEGPDGNIYVVDYRDYYIKVFSPAGKYLKSFAGRGEGPGLAKRMGGFGFSPDKKSLFFTEFLTGHPWITFFYLQGSFNKVFNLNIPGMFGITDAIMLPDGRFLLTMFESSYCKGMIEKKANYFMYHIPQKLLLIDHKGAIIKEIVYAKYATSVSMSDNGADITIPFKPVFLWISLKDKIIFSDGLSTKLKVINYEGKLIGEIATPLPEPGKVSDKDVEKWRDDIKAYSDYKNKTGAFSISSKVIDLYDGSIYQKKPNLSSLSLTPDENILIAGVTDKEKKSKTYWLLDGEGKLLSKVVLKVNDLQISRHYLFVKVADEEDNTIVKFINRVKNEKEDILDIETRLSLQDCL